MVAGVERLRTGFCLKIVLLPFPLLDLVLRPASTLRPFPAWPALLPAFLVSFLLRLRVTRPEATLSRSDWSWGEICTDGSAGGAAPAPREPR